MYDGDDLHRRLRGSAGRTGVALRVAGGAGAVFFPEDDGELVTADAGDQVVVADAAALDPNDPRYAYVYAIAL